MKIQCRHDKLLLTSELLGLQHPKNPNTHTEEQIKRLAKIMLYQGIRHPIVISNLTGLITKGHGRLLAAVENKWLEFPVEYQDYASEEQEYADIVSDNAIAEWSILDLGQINLEIPDLGPDFDIGLLGLKSFFIDASDRVDPNAEWNDMPEFTQEDKTAFRSLVVHFHNQEGVNQFARATEQNITPNTRMLWYPNIIIERAADKRYGSETDES